MTTTRKTYLTNEWRENKNVEALKELRANGWVKGNWKRTFGIEIECFVPINVGRDGLAAALERAGIPTRVENYNHTTRNHWKIVTDASISAPCGNIGLELVSPVLSGKDGETQVRKVCEVLNGLNAGVNKSCGLHVHHGAKDMNLTRFKRLYHGYYHYEREIDSMMAPSRKNNTYCKSPVAQLSAVQYAKSLRKLSEHWDRYCKINFKSYVVHGTVEFRQHQGTTEAQKILEWVRFGQAMIRWAFRVADTTHANIIDQLELTQESVAYWEARKAKFSRAA